jgi:hypothetical protein
MRHIRPGHSATSAPPARTPHDPSGPRYGGGQPRGVASRADAADGREDAREAPSSDVAALRREAAGYRRGLRETERERDALDLVAGGAPCQSSVVPVLD